MMAKGPIYNVAFRRRREGKTNYRLRKKLISSGLPRIVARRTRKHIITQLVKPTIEGDIIITSAHSRELRKEYGYKGNLNNIPSSYLTGFLCGNKIIKKGIEKAVLDIGLQTPSRGARVFAILKGFLDAGVNIPHNVKMLPNEKRIKGQHIADYASKLTSDHETTPIMFSTIVSQGLSPNQISDHFSQTKGKIVSSFID